MLCPQSSRSVHTRSLPWSENAWIKAAPLTAVARSPRALSAIPFKNMLTCMVAHNTSCLTNTQHSWTLCVWLSCTVVPFQNFSQLRLLPSSFTTFAISSWLPTTTSVHQCTTTSLTELHSNSCSLAQFCCASLATGAWVTCRSSLTRLYHWLISLSPLLLNTTHGPVEIRLYHCLFWVA